MPPSARARVGCCHSGAGRVVQAALEAELTEQLRHPPGGPPQGAADRDWATADSQVPGRDPADTAQTELGRVSVRTRVAADLAQAPDPARRTGRRALGLYATVRDISVGSPRHGDRRLPSALNARRRVVHSGPTSAELGSRAILWARNRSPSPQPDRLARRREIRIAPLGGHPHTHVVARPRPGGCPVARRT